MKELLFGAALWFVLSRRPKPAAADEDTPDPEEPASPFAVPAAYKPYLDMETLEEFGNPIRPGSGFPGFIPPSTPPTWADPVTTSGINPGGIPAPQVGPGAPMTEDQLHAAGAVYNSVVANAYPGFTQMWLNTQNLANWQHKALERNVSLAERAYNFHKRLRKKIFG